MMPAASVSGFYFSHPLPKYFNVGRIGQDQVSLTLSGVGKPVEEIEKWRSPDLAYQPALAGMKG